MKTMCSRWPFIEFQCSHFVKRNEICSSCQAEPKWMKHRAHETKTTRKNRQIYPINKLSGKTVGPCHFASMCMWRRLYRRMEKQRKSKTQKRWTLLNCWNLQCNWCVIPQCLCNTIQLCLYMLYVFTVYWTRCSGSSLFTECQLSPIWSWNLCWERISASRWDAMRNREINIWWAASEVTLCFGCWARRYCGEISQNNLLIYRCGIYFRQRIVSLSASLVGHEIH